MVCGLQLHRLQAALSAGSALAKTVVVLGIESCRCPQPCLGGHAKVLSFGAEVCQVGDAGEMFVMFFSAVILGVCAHLGF